MTNFTWQEIKRLHGQGFAVHWLKPKSKMPLLSGWTKGPRLELDQLKSTYRKGYNVGVRLGAASKLAKGFLAVIDLDVKSSDLRHAQEAQEKLHEIFGPIVADFPCVLSGRGNGSAHYYVAVKAPISGSERKGQSREFVKVKMPSVDPSKKETLQLTKDELAAGYRLRPAWEISLLSEGRQVVLPGSIHPDTGRCYEWSFETLVDSPEIPLLTLEASNSGASFSNEHGDAKAAEPRKLPLVNVNRLGLRPDQVAAIVSGEGVEDRSAACFSIAMALLKRGVAEEKIISVLTEPKFYLGQTGYDHAKTKSRARAAIWIEKYCIRKAKTKVDESSFDFAVKEVGEDSEGDEDPDAAVYEAIGLTEEWQKELDLQKGRADSPPTVKATFKNVRLILENDVSPELLQRNLFTNEDIWNVDTPWGYSKGDKRSGNDDDALQVKSWLIDSVYQVEVSVHTINEALNTFAVQNGFHPVKDFLSTLEWDGVERIDEAFKTYLGAQMPSPYGEAVSRKFFLALMARIYNPGCKFDHIVVFEGKQGIGKSTFGPMLVGHEWFIDGLPDLGDKDAALNLQGIWLCEMSELASLYRSQLEQAKSFITRTTDKVRPPYGHRRIELKRSSVFYGTTNAGDYLHDSTGNRRFWPVWVSQLNFSALKKDRLQLLAEAKWCYDNLEEPLYLTGRAEAQAKKIQALRRVDDESDSMEARVIDWTTQEETDLEKEYSLYDLFDNGPFVAYPKNHGTMLRAATAMRNAGYLKVHGRSGNRWRFRTEKAL